MTTLSAGYDPKTFESRVYAQWEASGAFAPRGEGEPYVILLPPPNVTGTLHMGHAFQHTLQDALVRYHRMRGYDTLWQMGSDHAGIATEMVVSRNLAIEGQGETRDSLGREGFIDKVWEWKQQSGDTIERQMRRLGTSGDWSRTVFTMDPMAADAVREAFVRLHADGLIYRGQRLVNWDPVLQTAISDLEVVNEEEDGFLWSIAYPLSDGSGQLVVATTRPETMLGDTAVMVHPDDERYAHLVGKTVTLPLTGREIPIIADAYVDREFGTGIVKVTPAHDFNDYAVGQRHGLPLVNIFTADAKINDNAPEKYRGLDRYDARKAVLTDLDALGLLVDTKKHKLQVPRGDRSGQAIEPYLTDQWFVKMDGLARRGLELVQNGSVRFVPPNWINTYRHWMENIQDWCISRQLWWGHRIPAWYDDAGNVYVARTEADAYRRAGLDPPNIDASEGGRMAAKGGGSRPAPGSSPGQALRQDNDVLETWFSSALWPISTMGWPDAELMRERGFDRYVPSSVLVTGFDIIFFWVARMIFMTDHLVGQDQPAATDAQRVPFRDVYITGLVRDKDGQKMSKSKGNVLDPLDIIDGIAIDELVAKRTSGLMQPKMAARIEKATRKEFPQGIAAHGADPLRFTMAALAGPGRDIKFDLGRADGYRNFCNKLWNATRFVLMNTEGAGFRGAPQPRTPAEHWILHALENLCGQMPKYFEPEAGRSEDAYRFDLATHDLYEFAWNRYCDWFVEMAKPALSGDDAAAAASTRHTLLYVLERLLRLLHPLIPFVTEELWRHVAPRLGIPGDTISRQEYPRSEHLADPAQASDFSWVQAAVSQLRALRSQMGIAPARRVPLVVEGEPDDPGQLQRHASALMAMARLESVRMLAAGEPVPPSMALPLGRLKLHVPLEGLVDLDAERARLDKELKRVEGELARSQGKLASETFVRNAPPAVVEQERKRLADWSTQRAALAAQREKLS